MAIFLGGSQILEHLSTNSDADPLNYYNVSILIISPMLWLLLTIYKKMKFREQVGYMQTLQQVIVTGRTNTMRKIIIFGQFLFCAVFFFVHFWVSRSLRKKAEEEDPIETAVNGNIFIGFIMTVCCSFPLLGNRALR